MSLRENAESAATAEQHELLAYRCASVTDHEVVLALQGEIDMSTAPLFRDLLDTSQTLAPTVSLDMSEVTFLDSSGIDELVRAHRRGRVRVREVSTPVERCLLIAGLAERFADPVARARPELGSTIEGVSAITD